MTKFRTNNPIGSTDVLDLYDNAENFDHWANDRENRNHEDRFGVQRKTWWGMEQDFQQFLIDSGYVNIGDYGPGLEITERNQIFWRDGELYRAGAVLELPYTTTGDWGSEEGLFVAVGDAALRQELTADGGASIVGNAGIVFNDTTEMISATWLEVGQTVRTLGYHTQGDGGGNQYEIVAAGTGTADGGNFIDLTGVSAQAAGLFNEGANVKQFGVIGDGVADDTAAMLAFDGKYDYPVDLFGMTIKTTLSADQLTGEYFNGTILIQTAGGTQALKKTLSPVYDYQVKSQSTKSSVIDWAGKKILWLGTSIPMQGVNNGTSYPDKVAEYFQAEVFNQAWAGSHAYYDVDGDPFSAITTMALSMTEDDRLAGLALHGASSAYSDDFDPITKASQMTADRRIASQFASNSIDVVILDHNHNDRFQELGTLTPPSSAIAGITKGVTTTVTLSSPFLMVGDAVILRNTGIPSLNFASARVQSVSGSNVTLNINSSAYSGSFTGGTVEKVDRSTLYGAFDFLISYIKNASIKAGGNAVIMLASAPSEYTRNSLDNGIYSVARGISNIAKKWGLAYFDLTTEYKITEREHLVYLSDTIHPATELEREVLAAYWINWLSGGKVKPISPSYYLPNANTSPLLNNREAIYDSLAGGFTTPRAIFSDREAVFDAPFTGGFGAWTVFGGGGGSSITAQPHPDDPADGTAYAVYDGSNNVGIERSISPLVNPELMLEIWVDDVENRTTETTPRTISIGRLMSASGFAYAVNLVALPGSVRVQPVYYEAPGTGYTAIPSQEGQLVNGNNVISMTIIKQSALSPGRLVLTVNGQTVINSPIENINQVAVDKIQAGVMFSNIANFDYYITRVALFNRNEIDYSTRFTGSFQADGGETVTVVNGLITKVE